MFDKNSHKKMYVRVYLSKSPSMLSFTPTSRLASYVNSLLKDALRPWPKAYRFKRSSEPSSDVITSELIALVVHTKAEPSVAELSAVQGDDALI